MMAPSNASGTNGAENPVERFRFAMPGRLEYRDAAKAFLAYICERLIQREAFQEDVGHRVISAFVEAFNNAVIHAYDRAARTGQVEVELSVTRDRLELRIIDYGATFRPEAVPEPDLDALPEGGMGLFIMRSFMDKVSYAREGGRNIVTMEKSLNPASES